MVKITGKVKQFRRQRMLVGELEVGGVEFYANLDGGNRWFVDSSASAGGDGRTPGGAFDTLDEAFAACTANNGDVIYVMPNHAETVTGAGGIAHDVAGVSVVGLGIGNQRPRFLMDGATTVTYAITADDAWVENLVFAAGHADIVACITTTKKYTTIVDCEFVDNTADENFLTEIKATSTTNNDSDGLTVIGCRAKTPDTAGVEFVEINADLDGGSFIGNFVSKDGATASKFIFVATGKDLTNIEVRDNRVTLGATSGDLLIDNDTAVNSGVVAENWVGHHIAAGTALRLVDCDGVREFNNYSSRTDGDPIVDVNPRFGYHVTKVGDISAAPDMLFDVTGKCLITLMVGEVTSVIATSTSLSINTSTNDAVISASTQITTDAAGTLYLVSGDLGLGANAGGTPNVDAAVLDVGDIAPFVVNDDAIEQNVNGAGTGLIQWDLWYFPLEAGASVVAAA